MGDELLKEKAKMSFTLLDLNRDGVISRKDRDECEASFKDLFKPEGKQLDAMMENLGNFWKIGVFLFDTPDCNKTFTMDEFIQNRMKWYSNNRAGTMKELRKAEEHLFAAADVNDKNSLTFEDFRKVHKAFNIDNEDFVRKLFNLAGPDASGNCSKDDVVNFYTEYTTGEDAAKHALIKEAFVAAGFAL